MSNRGSIPRNCVACGSSFTVQPHVLRKGEGNFCSRRCTSSVHSAAGREKKILAARCKREKRVGKIQTSCGSWFLVDAVDQEYLEQFNWSGGSAGRRYVHTNYAKGVWLPVHRLIMERVLNRKLERSEYVDHINRDPLDNRRSNIRLATPLQNSSNIGVISRNTSGYRGVSFKQYYQRWEANIMFDGKWFFVGRFADASTAAWMRDQWALALCGDHAYTNFEYLPVQDAVSVGRHV